MSATKQKRLEQKKDSILTEAKKVLIKYGNNATMGDIAQALDMDKSSLYYYFKGIPEILNTILDREYYDFSIQIHDLRKNQAHIDVIGEIAKVILAFYYENLEILQIILTRIFPLFMERGSRDDTTAINNYMDSYWLANDLMLEEIEKGQAEGEFETVFSAEMILQTLRGAIFGICACWRKEKPELGKIPLLVDQILKIYLPGK